MCKKCWGHEIDGYHMCEWRIRYFDLLKRKNRAIHELKKRAAE